MDRMTRGGLRSWLRHRDDLSRGVWIVLVVDMTVQLLDSCGSI